MNKAKRGKRKNAGSHWELNPGSLTWLSVARLKHPLPLAQ